jgi:hypothetical protein
MDSETVVGAISVVEARPDGTLDEPVWVTLKRDIAAIGKKIVNVLMPRKNKSLLQDWDLWGPLALCIVMSVCFHYGGANEADQGGVRFVDAFLIIWIGAAIVTVNIQLLKGNVSFFQSVCTLGYCLTPLAIALILANLMKFSGLFSKIFKVLLCGSSLGWSVWAVLGFLNEYLPKDRKELAVYPIFLFYSVISGLILTSN